MFVMWYWACLGFRTFGLLLSCFYFLCVLSIPILCVGTCSFFFGSYGHFPSDQLTKYFWHFIRAELLTV